MIGRECEMRNSSKILVGNLKGRDHHLESNRVGMCELDSCGSGQGPVVSFCGHDNEPLGSVEEYPLLW